MKWYYERASQQAGPVSESELDALIASGEVRMETLLWREGMAGWEPMSVARPPADRSTFAPPPPPPPPTPPPTPSLAPAVGAAGGILEGLNPYAIPQADLRGVEVAVERDGPAWERRAEIGWVTAGFETVKAVLLEPSATFARMKREGGIGSPFLFQLILGSLGGLASVFYQMLLSLISTKGTGRFEVVVGLGLYAVMMPLLVAAGAFVGSGIYHLVLLMFGTKQPFEATFRTVCYTGGAVAVLQLVPGCGSLVAGGWALVCYCIGFSRVHALTIGRAVVVVLLPLLLCCAMVGLIAAGVGFFAART